MKKLIIRRSSLMADSRDRDVVPIRTKCHICGKKGVRYKEPEKSICDKCLITRHRKEMNNATFKAARIRHNKSLRKYGDMLLEMCDKVQKAGGNLDSAVRDTLADGLAYLVHAAEDCYACADEVKGDAFSARISTRTAKWFRKRGYVEWFCQAAASCFMTTKNYNWQLGKRSNRVKYIRRTK
jgi:hypothetical protein